MKHVVMAMAVALLAGCAGTHCVAHRRATIDPFRGANPFLGERLCREEASGDSCCTTGGKYECKCATTCPCWKNPDHR